MPTSLYTPVPMHARTLGSRLGLGDIQLRQPCSGYHHLCVCDRCLRADERVAARGQLRNDRQEIARLRGDDGLLELNLECAA